MTTRSSTLVVYRSTGVRELIDMYTVPVGEKILVKSVYLYNSLSGIQTCWVAAVRSAAAVTVPFVQGDVEFAQTLFWEGWTVLEAGDVLRGSFAGPNVHVWISGTVLPASF